MSREGSPATLIGRLNIGGNPGTMPPVTRGMLRRERNLAASQHASSRAVPSSSRSPALSTGRQPARAPISRASHSFNPVRGSRRPSQVDRDNRDDDDNDDDDDDDPSEGESDDDDPRHGLAAIMATFADNHPTPIEFPGMRPGDPISFIGSEQSQDCQHLARFLQELISRSPEVLATLRRMFPRAHCAQRLVNNLWKRDAAICRNLQTNLGNQAHGRDVSESIDDWRSLNSAIKWVLDEYWNDLTPVLRQSLAKLLIEILLHIFHDVDLYDGRHRTIVYAGESSGGNLFRRFLSLGAQSFELLGPLSRLDVSLLASLRPSLDNLINHYRYLPGNGPDSEQYRNVLQTLETIRSRGSYPSLALR